VPLTRNTFFDNHLVCPKSKCQVFSFSKRVFGGHAIFKSLVPEVCYQFPYYKSTMGSEYLHYSTAFTSWQHRSFTPIIAVDFGLPQSTAVFNN